MDDAYLFAIATTLIGWLVGRLSVSVDRSHEQRSSRNQLIFFLLEIFEDVAKRKVTDDVVLSYVDTEEDLVALRRLSREMMPDEASRSEEHLHETIRNTALYDPLLAQEVSSTLFSAQMLDRQISKHEFENKAEFVLMLSSLTVMDSAILNRLQRLTEDLATKNGLFQKDKVEEHVKWRLSTLKESIAEGRKFRNKMKDLKKEDGLREDDS